MRGNESDRGLSLPATFNMRPNFPCVNIEPVGNHSITFLTQPNSPQQGLRRVWSVLKEEMCTVTGVGATVYTPFILTYPQDNHRIISRFILTSLALHTILLLAYILSVRKKLAQNIKYCASVCVTFLLNFRPVDWLS